MAALQVERSVTSTSSLVLMLVAALSLMSVREADAQLVYRYYRTSCPNVESIIFKEVKKAFAKDKSIAPGLLRLIFHDCFVRGCDASILLAGENTERASATNSRLHGFEVIDAAKTVLEKVCPGVVSCADILAYASRDSVVLTGGQSWKVRAGRRDGRISNVEEPAQNLPPASAKTPELISTFSQKGLRPQQMVDLSGAHTIGVTHCEHLKDRIFSPVDPTMPKALLKQLQKQCPKPTSSTAFTMDRRSAHKFDVEYYKNIASGNGLMTSDQDIYTDESTRGFVVKNLRQSTFAHRFGNAMIAMTNIQPTVFPDGEIRKRCQFRN